MLTDKNFSAVCQQLLAGKETSGRNTVAVIQQGLNDLSFSVGSVDGLAGSKSINALKAFYQQAKLPARNDFSAATLVDIIGQIKLLKTAQTLVEQSQKALDAADYARATLQLNAAGRLSHLIQVPAGLRDKIEARKQTAKPAATPQDPQVADAGLSNQTTNESDLPTTPAKEESALVNAETLPLDTVANNSTHKLAEAVESPYSAVSAALLEAANGLQLTYQDKMGRRDDYHQELLFSIEALFRAPDGTGTN